jgi:hypothetical protein
MNPVTLIDGSTADSSGEQWRHECEARALLAMPLVKRRDCLYGFKEDGGRLNKGIKGHRGDAEVQRLEGTIMSIWTAQQIGKLLGMQHDEQEAYLDRIARATNSHMREILARKLEGRLSANANDNQGTI